MKKYLVNFGTGAGNEYADTIEEAKRIAVEQASYTQASIKIELVNEDDEEENEVIARLPWWGVQPGEDDEVIVDFGEFGFYGEWEDY
ncbi:MAG: hypothetical protein WDA59_07160 [Methanofastidiosum sp.]